jgi:hypothetical protein
MAVWRAFLSFKARQTAIIISSGLLHLTQGVQILKNVRQTASTICSGLSHPTGWAALPPENISQSFFSRVEKPSEDKNSRLFVMNIKGLKLYIFLCLRPLFWPTCNTEPWLHCAVYPPIC